MRPTLLVVPVLCALLAACGGAAPDTTAAPSDPVAASEETSAPSEAAPTSSEDPSEEPSEAVAAASEEPQRIVSLSPTHTETLFAIGAGDRVVAVDDQSDYPEDVPATDLSGFQPNVEAIAGYDPDLVVLSDDTDDVVAGLQAVGVETLLLESAATLDEAYGQIAQIGEAVGEEEAATAVVEEMRTEIDALAGSVPEREEPLTYFHELDPTLYTVTSDTFIGEVYSLAGLEGVVDEADPAGESGGYPQISPEFLIAADPDVYLLADAECCQQSAETLAERPGFADLTAVRDGRVVALDEDVASRWGPRIVDFVRTIVDAAAAVPVG